MGHMDRGRSRRALLESVGAAVAGGVAVGAAGCITVEDTDVFRESFEEPIAEWERVAAIGPEVPLEAFEWSIGRSERRAAEGSWSCTITTGGAHDDGTAWIVRPIELPDAETYRVDLQAWSPSESFNVLRHLVVVLAPESPRGEADFPDPGQNTTEIVNAPYGGLREPLHRAAGWEPYAFEWTPRERVGRAHLAVGASVVWEADVTHYVDAIRVTTA